MFRRQHHMEYQFNKNINITKINMVQKLFLVILKEFEEERAKGKTLYGFVNRCSYYTLINYYQVPLMFSTNI